MNKFMTRLTAKKMARYIRRKAKKYAKYKMLEHWQFCDNLLWWHMDLSRFMIDSGAYTDFTEVTRICDYACGYDIPYVAYKLGIKTCIA